MGVKDKQKQSGHRGVAGDAMGGFASAAMLIPQAMAFGVALLVPFGVSAGRAALSGLLCAAALSISSGIAGGTRAIVSSPTGPMLVMAAGVLGIAVPDGARPETVLAILSVLVILTGVWQALIGVTGGGRLIKFIPYSVTVGFLTGSAILMLMSQYSPLARMESAEGIGPWIWVPAATAAITIGTSVASKRFLHRVPGTITGLVAGTLFFHLAGFMSWVRFPGSWTIGSLPGVYGIEFPLLSASVSDLPWAAILVGSLAAAVLGSVDTLLTSVLADLDTGERHSAKKELAGQGAGHALSGLIGGMAGAGTTGATLVAIKSGGKRWPGVVAGALIVFLIVSGGELGALLPISALAGIIITVSLSMIDLDILAWLKRGRSRPDAAIAILVASVTVAVDLLAAVAVGVIIAVVMYLRRQVKAAVIHRKFSGLDFHSVCKRTSAQREYLSKHGNNVTICELRGDLFFATADRLFEELLPELERGGWLILNLRRVRNVDITGAKILQQMAERAKSHEGEIVFCEVHKGIGIGHDVGKTIRKLSPDARDINIRTFVNTDEALEFVEDRILRSGGLGRTGPREHTDFSGIDMLSGLDGDFVSQLESETTREAFGKGDVIFEKGDSGSELYFVLSGVVDIRLETTKHHYKRMASYSAGTVFGEVAFLKPGERTASAVAVEDCELAKLAVSDFSRFSKEHPEAAVAFLIELGRKQSEELRWSAHEIQRLGDW